jgi:hypothetical protein
VLQIRRLYYWRIELPVSNTEQIYLTRQLKETLSKILLLGKTQCPFRQAFTVELPETQMASTAIPTSEYQHEAETLEKPARSTGIFDCTASESETGEIWRDLAATQGGLESINDGIDTRYHDGQWTSGSQHNMPGPNLRTGLQEAETVTELTYLHSFICEGIEGGCVHDSPSSSGDNHVVTTSSQQIVNPTEKLDKFSGEESEAHEECYKRLDAYDDEPLTCPSDKGMKKLRSTTLADIRLQNNAELSGTLRHAILGKTYNLVMGPPSYLVSLMLKIAAIICTGEWRWGNAPVDLVMPVRWDYSSGEA